LWLVQNLLYPRWLANICHSKPYKKIILTNHQEEFCETVTPHEYLLLFETLILMILEVKSHGTATLQ
jgi:hypothetical protein